MKAKEYLRIQLNKDGEFKWKRNVGGDQEYDDKQNITE